jgi:uncharacterized protein (TIGR02284 family)
MNTKMTIENLNSLLVMNDDRLEGYKSALYEAKENDIKTMFSTFAQTSLVCRKEIFTEIKRKGGKKNNRTIETGKFFRIWTDMKKAIKKDDRKTILDFCKYAENAMLEEYQKIINESSYQLNNEEQIVLNKHYKLLKCDYEKVIQLHTHFLEEAC